MDGHTVPENESSWGLLGGEQKQGACVTVAIQHGPYWTADWERDVHFR